MSPIAKASIGRKLISNTFYLLLDSIVLTSFSFIYWVLVGKTLTPEQFGIIASSTVLISFFSIFVLFGINSAVSKLIPEYSEKNQKKKISSLIKFSFNLSLILNLILALILLFLSNEISRILKLPLEVFYIVIVGNFITSLSIITGSVIYGLQNMRKYFFTDLIGNISKIIISTIMILLGFSFFGPLIGFVLSYLIIFILRIEKNWFLEKSNYIDKKEVLMKYSLPAFVFSLVTFVFTSLYYLILPALTSQYETGLFAIANKITFLIPTIPFILSASILPTVSGLSAYQEIKKIKLKQGEIVRLALRYSLLSSIPIFSFFLIFSKALILTFTQESYIAASKLFFPLGLASLFYGLSSICLNALYAAKKPEIMRNISLLVTAIFLITSFPLTISYFSLGMSYSLLISMLTFFILSFFYGRKFLNFSIDLKSLIKIIFSNLLLSILFLLIDLANLNLFIKLFLIVPALLLYFLVLLITKFFEKKDLILISYFLEKFPKFSKYFSKIQEIISKYAK